MAALRSDTIGYAVRLAGVAAAYFVAARLSLDVALVNSQVTPVWPPTGIAVVALLVFGVRMWPAIAVAALAVNLPLGPNAVGAAIIAAGNTLAPLAAVAIMRTADFDPRLERLRDTGAIIAGALAGMAVSATVGSLVLTLLGPVALSAFPQTWAVWWTGDAMGVLLVAPFLLSFLPAPGRRPLSWRRRAEMAVLLGAIAIVTYVVFQNRLRLEYVVFPLIMLAAYRFQLRGAAPAALISSGVAVIAAVNGTGPFATESLLQKMVTLQVYNVFLTLASFVLASYVETAEREQRARLESKTKSEFLQVAAHELRGPLSVVAGYVSLLSGGDLGEPPGRWREPLEILNAKTHELNDIMDQLLEVSSLNGDVMVPSRRPVDLRALVAAAAERSAPRAALAGGSVTVAFEGEGPVVAAVDAVQVGHILDNLVNNGLTYSRGEPKVELRVSHDSRRVRVVVSDTGAGIPESMRDALFEPFRRGRQPGFEAVPGTGLGLYISRELARAHGGELTLERSSAEGSVFALSLPVHVTEPIARA